jgi:hypothetical protein
MAKNSLTFFQAINKQLTLLNEMNYLYISKYFMV